MKLSIIIPLTEITHKVYSKKYSPIQILPLHYSDWDPNGCVFSKNIIYKNENKEWFVSARILKKHRHTAFDFYTVKDNLVGVDPKFVDEENMNFDLQDNSPAYNLRGFIRIPFEQIGVQHF